MVDRIVGWRDGKGLTRSEVKAILKDHSEKGARQEYKKVQKTLQKIREKPRRDPARDLPANWQAFYATMPHLNAVMSYKEAMREEKAAQAKAKKRLSTGEANTEEKKEALKKELLQKKKQLDATCEGHKKTIRKFKMQLKEEVRKGKYGEEEHRRILDRQSWWYKEWGIWTARLNSSKKYFDQKRFEAKQADTSVAETLQRAATSLDDELFALKMEVMGLLEDEQEKSMQTSSRAGDSNQPRLENSSLPPTP